MKTIKTQIYALCSCLGGLSLLLLSSSDAWAADHLNLEEGLPTEVEDAYPVPYKGREIQSVLQYERNGDDDQILIEPRFEYESIPLIRFG